MGGEGKSPKKLNSPGDLSFSLSPMMYISPEGASSSTSEAAAAEDAHQHTETGREEKGRRGNICFIQDDRMRRRRQCPDKREELDGRLSLLPSSSSARPGIVSNFAVPSTQKKTALPLPLSHWVGGVLWFDHRNFGPASLACVTRSKKEEDWISGRARRVSHCPLSPPSPIFLL